MKNVGERSLLELDNDQIPLGLHITVTSVHDIDTTKEIVTISFDADIFIKISEQPIVMDCGKVPTNRNEAVEELQNIFAESFVIGQLETIQEDMTTDDWGADLLPDVYGGEVKFTVTLKVDMSLGNFPFDAQTITLRFFQQYDRRYKFICPSKFWKPGSDSLYATRLATTPTMLVSEEWNLHAPRVEQTLTLPQQTISSYSQVSVYIPLSRKASAYVFRFVLVMAAVSFSAIAPFVIPDMETGDMLAHEVGLLFAAVAFQLLVSSFLPVSSTLSILDQYGMFLFFFVFACMLTITLHSYFNDHPNFEPVAFWLAISWLMCHALFSVQVSFALKERHKKITTCTTPPRQASYIVKDDMECASVSLDSNAFS